MRNLSLLLIFVSAFAFSQTNRFIYEYRYIPNLQEKDSVKKEMMALDINAEGSVYQSMARIKQDSVMKDELNKAITTGGRGRSMNFRNSRRLGQGISYKVTKEYPEFKTFLHERISMDGYKIAEDEAPVWKIMPETQQIGEYKGQKATTDFGGRSWIAWFSSEIPFQDGPYKFHGLPGLIVKLEDASGSHIMTLVANIKINSTTTDENKLPPGVEMLGLGRNEIPVTEKQFQKVYQDYLADPAKNMRQMLGSSDPNRKVVIQMRTQDGKEISDVNEMARMMEKGVKESEAKNNNRIEPDLYRKK